MTSGRTQARTIRTGHEQLSQVLGNEQLDQILGHEQLDQVLGTRSKAPAAGFPGNKDSYYEEYLEICKNLRHSHSALPGYGRI